MKAAIFDVDGTLVDSIEFWTNLGKNYLISLGITPREDLNKALETLTVEEGISYMQERYKIPRTLGEIKNEMDELLYSYYKKQVKLKPFVIELLEVLRQKDIKLGIASVIDEKLISSVLNRYGIYDYFEFVQTCENTGLSKDDKDFYKLLSKRLDLKAEEIFLFEDSLYCMKAAKKADLNIVAVEDDYSKKDLENIMEVADIYIKDFGKFISFISL